MATDARRQLLLVLATVLLALVAYRLWPGATTANAPPSSNVRSTGRTQQGGQSAMAAPDVRLEALNEERAKPADVERNLFRFKSKPAPPAPPSVAAAPKPAPPAPSGPPPPPP